MTQPEKLSEQFLETEDLESYFEMPRQMLTKYGFPLAINSDRYTIFRSSKEDKLTIEDEFEGNRSHSRNLGEP